MEEIKLDIENPKTIEEGVEKSQEALASGGVVVFPTDTIYGLGANALDEHAISKIYKIKNRDINKPISILVRDIAMAKKVACIDSKVEEILKKIWPNSVTVVLRKKDVVPYILTANEENIALRISNNFFIKKLFEKNDFPITATSANISGEENLLLASEIIKKFADAKFAPDLFINAGNLQNRLPSTIIDLTDANNPRLVRMGIVGKDRLSAFFKNFL
ncbi:MAG: L-threonylcarbamoyladenylate synthase [Candidatus Paceibacterota bacterium]